MKNTTNFNLKKPEYSDLADISVMNDNMDTIDNEMKKIKDGYEPKLEAERKRKILYGTDEPNASLGAEGDIYIQYE